MLRRGFKLVFGLALLLFTMSVAIATPAYAGVITLYEGNGGQQDVVDMLPDRPDYSGGVKQNDEARSLVLENVEPSIKIRVFDDPNGAKDDDYTVISVKEPPKGVEVPPRIVIGTFEYAEPFENEFVKVEHHHDNGLDGKVSRIEIEKF